MKHQVDWIQIGAGAIAPPVNGMGPVWAYGAYEFDNKGRFIFGAVYAKYNGVDWYTWNTDKKMISVTHWAGTITPEPPTGAIGPGSVINTVPKHGGA